MSETTAPTGGSNVTKITKTNEDYNKLFGFEIVQMDFEVDKNRNKDEKEGDNGSSSGNGSDTTTPIIPGNHLNISGLDYAKIFGRNDPTYIMVKPLQEGKGKDKDQSKDKEENENEVGK